MGLKSGTTPKWEHHWNHWFKSLFILERSFLDDILSKIANSCPKFTWNEFEFVGQLGALLVSPGATRVSFWLKTRFWGQFGCSWPPDPWKYNCIEVLWQTQTRPTVGIYCCQHCQSAFCTKQTHHLPLESFVRWCETCAVRVAVQFSQFTNSSWQPD